MFMRDKLSRAAHARDDAMAELNVTIDGVKVGVARYTTVAAALAMAQGIGATRVSVGGMARAPFCGMGVCQECRVTVDGRAYVLACQTVCRDGMRVETEHAPR
jgi:predicted molibdopterin-dependent oxidoreductase YjgC